MMRGQEKEGEQGWDVGTSRKKKKRWGVTLSCQLVLGANAHVMQRKRRGKSEMQGILASSYVKGGYCKLL